MALGYTYETFFDEYVSGNFAEDGTRVLPFKEWMHNRKIAENSEPDNESAGTGDTFAYAADSPDEAEDTFEEKLDGDSIVVTVKGNANVEGTYTFPVKDGYLTFEMNSSHVQEVRRRLFFT